MSLSTPVVLLLCRTPVISLSLPTPVLSLLLPSLSSLSASAAYLLLFICSVCVAGSCIYVSSSHSNPVIFPSILSNASFDFSSGRISFTVAPVRFSKIRPLFCFSARAIAATRSRTIVGVGTSVNCPQNYFFQILERRNYMCPIGCLWDLGILPFESTLLACCSHFYLRVPVCRRQSVTCISSFNQVLFLS